MNLTWNSKITDLSRSTKKPQYIKSLESAGIIFLKDLLWIIPLRARNLLSEIDRCQEGDIFYSKGKLKSVRSFRNFRARGKNRASLYNITAIIEAESKLVELKWFNAYPNVEKSLKSKDEISLLRLLKNLTKLFKSLIQAHFAKVVNSC